MRAFLGEGANDSLREFHVKPEKPEQKREGCFFRRLGKA